MGNRFKALSSMTKKEQASYIKNFWLLVDRRSVDECWPWLGKTIPQGYGYLYHPIFNTTLAHVLAFMCARGCILIKPTLDVMHTCNSMLCCNPSHLVEGTSRQNIQYRFMSGRGFTLHPLQVLCVKALASSGINQALLGGWFRITQPQVSKIKNNKRWWYCNVENMPVA